MKQLRSDERREESDSESARLQNDSRQASLRRSSILIDFLGDKTIDLDTVAFSCDERFAEYSMDSDISTCDRLDGVDGEYARFDVIAEGGQAQIFRSRDRCFGRQIAIKSLRSEMRDHPGVREHFLREAKIMAQLDHPSIVPIYALRGDENRGLHLAMKLIDGKTLRAYLDKLCSLYELMPRKQLADSENHSFRRRLEIFLRLCDAMTYAHHRNVIHRDLKPENIMIGKYNEAYILDWGIAEDLKNKHEEERRFGTLGYIAPEILRHQPYDQRSDIYSLGLILFELVFLKPAFLVGTTKTNGKPGRRIHSGFHHRFGFSVPAGLKLIIAKAMAERPEERYQNLSDFSEDIRRFLLNEEISVNPSGALRRLYRLAEHHRKLIFFFSFCLLAVMLLMGGIYGYREQKQRMETRSRAAVLGQIRVNGFRSGVEGIRRLLACEDVLRNIAAETALRLFAGNDVVGGGGADAEEVDFHPGFFPDADDRLSLRASGVLFPWEEAPGVRTAELLRLMPLLERFQKSQFVLAPEEPGPFAVSPEKMLFSDIYLGLPSGLFLGYPRMEQYFGKYDPRTGMWYRKAASSASSEVIWSVFSDTRKAARAMISAVIPIRNPNGVFLGGVGMNIPVDILRRQLAQSGNRGRAVLAKRLVRSDRTVVVDTSRSPREGEVFLDRQLFERMWNDEFGQQSIGVAGERRAFFYFKLTPLNWLYVEEFDLDELQKQWR